MHFGTWLDNGRVVTRESFSHAHSEARHAALAAASKSVIKKHLIPSQTEQRMAKTGP